MDKHNWYYRFLADTDWLNSHHGDIDNALWNLLLEITENTGAVYGLDVSQRGAGANFSVDVGSGVAYDTYGRRILNNATTNVPFAQDVGGNNIEVLNPGNERIVSVYAYYHITDSSPAIDGFGDTVFEITSEDVEFRLYQGAEALAGAAVPAPNPGNGGILLAHVTIAFGDITVDNPQIDTSVKEELTILGFSGFVHDTGSETIDGDWSFNNGSTITFYSDNGVTQTVHIDGSNGNITTIGTVDGVDVSDHDHSGPNQGGTVEHGDLTSIGTYTHAAIDSHINDASIHFTVPSIDHGSISGLGDDDHPQYTHINQSETITQVWLHNANIDMAGGSLVDGVDVGSHIHTGGSNGPVLDHGNLSGLGDDDHPQYAAISQNETIGGSWTFNNPVVGQTPTIGSHLATKTYVDTHAGATDHGALTGLGDDDHTQYLHLNKAGQTLQQSLACAGGVTIDGININIHTHSLSLARGFYSRGQQVRNTSVNITLTIGGYTASDAPGCSIMMIDMTQGGGGFDSDNRALIGGTSNLTFSGFHSPDVPAYSGGNWEFRVEQSAGDEDVVCGYLYWVVEATDTTGGPS
jgi:hypothetical protein